MTNKKSGVIKDYTFIVDFVLKIIIWVLKIADFFA